jgi:hypothetical protein
VDDSDHAGAISRVLLAARNLFSLTSLDDLVENILKYSRVMMQAEACSMFLPDRATRELIIYSARGKDDAITRFRIPWDKGIAGTVFHERKFLRIDDAQNDPRLLRVRQCRKPVSSPAPCSARRWSTRTNASASSRRSTPSTARSSPGSTRIFSRA